MKAVEITDERNLVLASRVTPHAVGTDVEVDVAFCGVCGSDLHMLHDPDFPAKSVLGHEFAGTVAAVGDGVTSVVPGDAVTVIPYEQCGECRYCVSGRENLCVTGGHHGSVLGVDRPGGLSGTVVVDERALVTLPEGVSLEAGALAEPVAVALRAVERLGDPVDGPVIVIGAGPIGVLVSLIARAKGHGDIELLERNPARREKAAAFGLRVTAVDDTDPEAQLATFDAAAFVDCSGAAPAISGAIDAVRRGGRVVLVGLGSPVKVDAAAAILDEVEVIGSAGYSRSDFAGAVDLLAEGTIPSDALITRIAPVADAQSVFAELADPATSHVKVLLRH